MLSAILLATAAVAVEPTWLVGSGLYYAPNSDSNSALLNLAYVSGAVDLGPSDAPLGLGFSLERRLTEGAWLMFLATGSYRSEEYTSDTFTRSNHSGSVAGSVGPRFVLTESLPVEVAIYSVASLSYASTDSHFTTGSTGNSATNLTDAKVHQWSLGVRGGLTFDRTLVEGLGVRLGLNALGLGWSKGRDDVSGREIDKVSVGLSPEASLLLTMTF